MRLAAQLEDGYTQIAHELLEKLSKTQINGTQANILFFIFRYTYGFHRKSHELGNAFIAEGTAIRKDQVKRELNRLIEMKIIKVFEESTHTKSRVLGINTKTDEWTNTIKPQGAKKTPGVGNDTTVGANQYLPPGGELPPQDIYSSKNNLKQNNTTTGHTFDPYIQVLDEFCELHKKSDLHMKTEERTAIRDLLKSGIPPFFIISTMKKMHKQKASKGDKVTSFVYYFDAIKQAWKAGEEDAANAESVRHERAAPDDKPITGGAVGWLPSKYNRPTVVQLPNVSG